MTDMRRKVLDRHQKVWYRTPAMIVPEIFVQMREALVYAALLNR